MYRERVLEIEKYEKTTNIAVCKMWVPQMTSFHRTWEHELMRDLNENEVMAKISIKRSLYYLNSEGMKQSKKEVETS